MLADSHAGWGIANTSERSSLVLACPYGLYRGNAMTTTPKPPAKPKQPTLDEPGAAERLRGRLRFELVEQPNGETSFIIMGGGYRKPEPKG